MRKTLTVWVPAVLFAFALCLAAGCGPAGGISGDTGGGGDGGGGGGDGGGGDGGTGPDLTNVAVTIDRADSGPAELENAGGLVTVTALIEGLAAADVSAIGNVVVDISLAGAAVDSVPVEASDDTGLTYAVGYTFPRNDTLDTRTYEIIATAEIDSTSFESGPYYVLVRSPQSPPDMWRP